ncbi:4'-phosphopantetheinyl transferase family protein [Chitinibacteraceae bacterium HSL-7]
MMKLLPSPFVGVDVWQVDIDFTAPVPAGLQPDEMARMARYRRAEDRRRFAQVRVALRQLLGAALACDPLALAMVAGTHGKPRLADGGVQFNVSHTGSFGLIALSREQEVGVDIEAIKPGRDLAGLAAKVLSAGEIAWMNAGDPTERFYQLWAMKEAVVKARGTGIAGELAQLDVMPLWSGGELAVLPAPQGYCAALAIQQGTQAG